MREFMSPASPEINPKKDLLRASQLILQAGVDILLPVVKDNQLKGMLRLLDVFDLVSCAILTP